MRPTRLIPLLLALAACTKANPPASDTSVAAAGKDTTSAASPKQSEAEARDAIAKVRSAWKDAADRKDAASVAALYTDDATFVGTESPIATGRQGIEAALAKSFPVIKSTTIDSKELTVSGDIAYDYGSFTQEVTPPNAKPQTINGYYLVVVRRQPDGNWKIARHVSTTPPTKT